MTALLLLVFWSSLATIFVVTFGYPLFLLLTVWVSPRRRILEDIEPTVSLIISAYNEETVIAAKLRNSLLLDYPRDRLQIIVASDGSSDGTDKIVQSFAQDGVVLERFPRTGKTGMQNRVVKRVTGEILVFSDANAFYKPNAIRMLVRNFSDPEIGGVCGQLEYDVRSGGAGSSEGAYWHYEKFIKRRESVLSSVVGANGSIYAIRRADYVDIDDGLISDFVEPLTLVRNGRRFVYEAEAVSVEAASTAYGTEYRRKVRILTRSIRGLLHMRALLNPLKFGVFAVQLIMHKLLRFLTPLFLATGLLALTGLAITNRYEWLFATVVATTAVAIFVTLRTPSGRHNIFVQICHLAYYYIMANYALVLAWRNVLIGQRMTLWAPERSQT